MAKKTLRKKAQRKKAGKRRPPSRTAKKKVVAVDLTKMDVVADPTLRLAWSDRMTLAVRGDVPVATLGFYSVVENKLHEAAHLQTSTTHLKAMVDVICRNIDYYPKKPSK